MKKLLITWLIFMFIFPPMVLAAPKLENCNAVAESSQKGQVIWKVSGLGKISEKVIIVPDDKLIIAGGNRIYCVNLQGKLLWEAKTASGKIANPVVADNGSIYTAGKGQVIETKINGTRGWSFTVLPGGKDKEPQMAGGSGNLIYLPLPYALYALNTSGHSVWVFTPWDSCDRHTTQIPGKRSFITCAADEQSFYTVYADEKGSYRIIAIDSKANKLWNNWLGDIIDVHILPGGQDKVYVTATFKSSKRPGKGKSSTAKLNQGRIYCFNRNTGKELWQYKVNITDTLTEAVLYDDELYVTGGSNLYVLDANNGILKWETRLLDLSSPPGIDENSRRLYAGSSEGKLYAVNSSGRLDWSRQLEGAIYQAPLLGPDGYIYVCTQKGNLYKIKDNANLKSSRQPKN
jgi:outer membrane protein assembly factor BamB